MDGATNLTDLLLNASRECWLALNEQQSKIVGSGVTILEAVEESKEKWRGRPHFDLVPQVMDRQSLYGD